MWGPPSGAHKILCSAVVETGVAKMLDKRFTPDLVLWPSNGNLLLLLRSTEQD